MDKTIHEKIEETAFYLYKETGITDENTNWFKAEKIINNKLNEKIKNLQTLNLEKSIQISQNSNPSIYRTYSLYINTEEYLVKSLCKYDATQFFQNSNFLFIQSKYLTKNEYLQYIENNIKEIENQNKIGYINNIGEIYQEKT